MAKNDDNLTCSFSIRTALEERGSAVILVDDITSGVVVSGGRLVLLAGTAAVQAVGALHRLCTSNTT